MIYILLSLTAYNLFVAFRYILSLEKDIDNEKYIYGDPMHSLQHIAIAGITVTLSVAMLFGVVSDYTLLIYLVYNSSLAFIIYPHLI